MDGAGAEFVQMEEMQRRAVSLVLAEAILGEARAEFPHHPIARDLRDHAGGGDAETVAIAVDDRGLRKREGEDGQAIDEDVLGRRAQRGDGDAHGLVRRAQDVDAIDFERIDNADGPEDIGVAHKFGINFLAQVGEELFGILQTFVPEFFGENNGGCDDGSGERAAPGFIDPGDARQAQGAELAFMTKTTTSHAETARRIA